MQLKTFFGVDCSGMGAVVLLLAEKKGMLWWYFIFTQLKLSSKFQFRPDEEWLSAGRLFLVRLPSRQIKNTAKPAAQTP